MNTPALLAMPPIPDYLRQDLSHMNWIGMREAVDAYARQCMQPLADECERLRAEMAGLHQRLTDYATRGQHVYWRLVEVIKKPKEDEVGNLDFNAVNMPVFSEYEESYRWEAKIGAITKDGRPPAQSTLESERDALRARVAELEADAGRLDWISDPDNASEIGVYGYVRNLRERIDAAMKADAEKKT